MLASRCVAWGWAAAAMALGAAGAAVADDVVVPMTARDTEGNSDNLFPFGGDPMRYQQVFSAGEFGGQARWITGLALRPDAANGSAFSETLSSLEVHLSTSRSAPGTLSLTFAENVGADDAVVFSGSIDLASGNSGDAAGPKAFDVVIPFAEPFWYDPSAGNLLLDVKNLAGGRTTQYDAQDAHDSIARVWARDPQAATAKSDDPYPSVGLVVQFLVE